MIFIPCVAVEFSALVHAEDEKDVLGSSVRSVQYELVVLLCRPETILDAYLQISLERITTISKKLEKIK